MTGVALTKDAEGSFYIKKQDNTNLAIVDDAGMSVSFDWKDSFGQEIVEAKAYAVEDACLEHVTTFFSEERKRLGTEKVDQLTLHNWLSLARMVTLSNGKTAMTTDCFQEAVRLDQSRV